MTGQQRHEIHRRDASSAQITPALESQAASGLPENEGALLRLLQSIRHAGHELNNLLTAAHCLVDLLAEATPAGSAHKYTDDLRSLLSEFAAMGEFLRREGNSALNANAGLRNELCLTQLSPRKVRTTL